MWNDYGETFDFGQHDDSNRAPSEVRKSSNDIKPISLAAHAKDNTAHLLIAVNKHDAEGRRLESSAAGHRDVVALADVVNVDRDAGVRSDAVLLHQRDELRLRQIVGRARLLLDQFQLSTRKKTTTTTTHIRTI